MHELCSLAATPGVRMVEFRCRAPRGAPARDEQTERDEIVLPRRGLFVRRRGSREEVADATRCMFFARGEGYRVRHPAPGGDVCTVLALAPERLEQQAARFERSHAPVVPKIDLLHRRLLEAARCRAIEPLAIDEALHALAGALIGLAVAAPRESRPGDARRRALAMAAQELLAERFRDTLRLDGIAAALGCSPFHLCRAFKAETGATLHRHVVRLRLRAAAEAIGDGARDLTRLALELGFCDHAHLTRAFRRELGRPPSALRDDVGIDELRALSKDVQAARRPAA